MSPIVAMIVAFALHALVLLPLAISWLLPRTGRVIGLIYVAAAAGVGLYHTGIFHSGSLARSDIAIPVVTVGPDDPRCAQFLDALKSAGMDIDAPDATQRLEAVPGWQQVPDEGRQLIRDCLRGTVAN